MTWLGRNLGLAHNLHPITFLAALDSLKTRMFTYFWMELGLVLTRASSATSEISSLVIQACTTMERRPAPQPWALSHWTISLHHLSCVPCFLRTCASLVARLPRAVFSGATAPVYSGDLVLSSQNLNYSITSSFSCSGIVRSSSFTYFSPLCPKLHIWTGWTKKTCSCLAFSVVRWLLPSGCHPGSFQWHHRIIHIARCSRYAHHSW
jgi:hypothetical protein